MNKKAINSSFFWEKIQTYGLSCVGFAVKVGKQDQEEQGVSSDEVDESHWVVAFVPEAKLEGVSHHSNELNLY